MAKEITTCIKTNISTHFLKYLYKYINIKFTYSLFIRFTSVNTSICIMHKL